ncbi:hypothetical protein OHA72_20900 [Dactylosporangium sp. NBC_01737]|uniref:hypothetical protein n=1 Tax=Dactylosporangium sp. NBC_01737 TaxID=2975959 RepID=UPI002E142FF9|nr:hypothetical protein OHA72_20900 [Dactylosporangium sp. NBC_01737]
MSDSLAALVRSFPDEPLRLAPGDPAAEWSANTRWFGIPDGAVDAPAVTVALDEAGRRLRVRFGDAPGPVTFYAWYDEQAGQLRCALRSVAPDALPFGARHVVVERPDPVVALIVADRHPGVVPWEELSESSPPAAAGSSPPPRPFPVFAITIAA